MDKQMTSLEAKRLLAEVNPAWKAFWFHNGPVIRSLGQMAQVLPKLPPELFGHHVSASRNDLVNWVKDVVGDKTLAADLVKFKDQASISAAVSKRVKELEGALAVVPAKAPAKRAKK